MRCALSSLTGVVLALAGCAAPHGSHTAAQLAWQRLCARMRPAPQSPLPAIARPLDTVQVRALEAAADRRRPAVVHIQTSMAEPATPPTSAGDAAPLGRRSGGTGVIITPDGLIVTAAHVVRAARVVRVVLADGASYPARAIECDPHRDLAVVSIDAQGLPTLAPDETGAPRGTAVVALGCPVPAAAPAARFGQVCAPGASLQHQPDPTSTHDFAHLIETTAALEPGFSGGPLLDAHGRLLGLHVAVRGRTTEHCRSYAQPLDPAALAELSARVRGR